MARRRGFRGSEDSHKDAFERALNTLDREHSRAKKAIKESNCDKAYNAMIWAARAEAQANVEANWAGMGYPSSLQRRVGRHDRLTSKFSSTCMRKWRK